MKHPSVQLNNSRTGFEKLSMQHLGLATRTLLAPRTNGEKIFFFLPKWSTTSNLSPDFERHLEVWKPLFVVDLFRLAWQKISFGGDGWNTTIQLVAWFLIQSSFQTKIKRTPCDRYFTLGALRQQCFFQTNLVERWCHGGKPAYSQDSVEPCQVTDHLPLWAFPSISFVSEPSSSMHKVAETYT